MNNSIYFNTDFDLRLGGYFSEQFERVTDSMTLNAIVAGDSTDTAYVKITPSDEYIEYLHSLKLEIASYVTNPLQLKGSPLAWGWNRNSYDLFRSAGLNPDSPSLEAVKSANSRSFSNDIAVSLDLPSGVILSSFEELKSYAGQSKVRLPLVVKADHGSAGSGFVFIKEDNLSESDQARIKALFINEDSRILVEEWRERVSDYSCGFTLGKDGSISCFVVNKTLSSPSGIFSALIPDTFPEADEIADRFRKVAQLAAEKLHSIGYFGNVGIDGYTYMEDGIEKFNPLSEINARLTMAYIPRTLRERYGSKASMIRSISKDKFRRAKSYQLYDEAFCDTHFHEGEGVILISPISYIYNKSLAYPARNTLYLAANSYDGLISLSERVDAILTR